MMVNGKVILVMGMAFRFGQTVPSTKDIGLKIGLAVKASFSMLMAIYLKVSGWTIKLMVKESISI